ncbi:hypothetical protein CHCC20488_0648 [Bacillus paralicheniformis]|uniref:Uncharacterized protein n=1 Tax=Bacillus paralicheniformis TaxID=1648923 RepID=A0ABY3FZ44_9BACI|nr:hypothetical protein CHCC15381_1602 [Bacillus paralicheniformis]TWM28652.1 hypothetical protein CHCC14821_2032 [Bacillus paralicheniformis]TWN40161.1 hypothetical protein CHCC14523_0252 [Bacillus paralicheniformis]TWN96693.1 hypothetical protein CHCC20488_0648 [Bacillus paralicheniformis]
MMSESMKRGVTRCSLQIMMPVKWRKVFGGTAAIYRLQRRPFIFETAEKQR